jgi:RND family efflux transporter MFP subunit
LRKLFGLKQRIVPWDADGEEGVEFGDFPQRFVPPGVSASRARSAHIAGRQARQGRRVLMRTISALTSETAIDNRCRGQRRSWRRLAAQFALGLTVAAGCGPIPLALAADAPRSSGSPKICVSECRVKLIDEATLASERAGVLAEVSVTEGDSVRAGQVVATLRDEAIRTSRLIAEVEATNDVQIRYSKKLSELSRIEYMQAIQSNHQVAGTVPDIEVRKLRMAAEKALLQIEQARHDFAVAALKFEEKGHALKSFQIVAPFDGFVTRVYKQTGEAVLESEPIVEIVSTQTMMVEGFVEMKDSYRIKKNAPATVQIDIPGVELDIEKLRFPARIEFVDVKVQPVTGKVRFSANVPNEEGLLRDGLMTTVTIDPDAGEPRVPVLLQNEKPRQSRR